MGYSVSEEKKIVCFDTETTGLSAENDEILQISMVDGFGDVLFDSLIRPERHTEWPHAMEVNQITPEMVKDKPVFRDILPKVQEIVSNADILTGYNVAFDVRFLKANGVEIPDHVEIADSMQYHDSHRVKLAIACEDLGYDWGDDRAHDSLSDTKAALYVYRMAAVRDLKEQARREACAVRYTTGKNLLELYRTFLNDERDEGRLVTKDNRIFELSDWLSEKFDDYRKMPEQERLALSDAIVDGVSKEIRREEAAKTKDSREIEAPVL